LSRSKEDLGRRRFLQEKFLNTARAKPGRQQLRIVLDHLKPSFNVGKIFRSADAFGVHEILLVGIPWFDPASAVGSFKHVKARFFSAFADAYSALRADKVEVFNLEVQAGPSLAAAQLPERCALVLGNEGVGQSFRRADFPDVGALRIPQWGRAQSLNVSVAAALGMYEYCRRWAQDPGPCSMPDRIRTKHLGPD